MSIIKCCLYILGMIAFPVYALTDLNAMNPEMILLTLATTILVGPALIKAIIYIKLSFKYLKQNINCD